MSGVPKAQWSTQRSSIGSGLYVENSEYRGLLVSQSHRLALTRSQKIARAKARTWLSRPRPSKPHWDGGGPFYTWQRTVDHGKKDTILVLKNTVGGLYYTQGSSGVIPAHASNPSDLVPSWSTVRAGLTDLYATGYKRTRPGNPVADVGVFLSETFRDGLPQHPGTSLRRAFNTSYAFHTRGGSWRTLPARLFETLHRFRYLGSEYLNVVFGWKPFINDLRKMYNLMKTIDKQMAKIVRENGKTIRRRARLESDKTSSQTSKLYALPYVNVYGGPPGYMTGSTYYTVTTTTKSKAWFVAAWQYHIPDTGSWLWDARARLALFGALPTPEVIYNALPWTWLIDWFSNLGDVVSNFGGNAVDNLVTRYSFTMKETTETVESRSQVSHSGVNAFGSYWPSRDIAFTSTMTTRSKSRVGGGNPFGLDVQLPSLTTGQLAILSALGISRGLVK